MTDSEMRQIAVKVVDEMKKQKNVFWVEPEQHYNDHKRTNRFFEIFDTGARIVGAIVITGVVGGLVWLITLGTRGIGK